MCGCSLRCFLFVFFLRGIRLKKKKQSLEGPRVGKRRKKRGRFDHQSKAKKKAKKIEKEINKIVRRDRNDFLPETFQSWLAVDGVRKMPPSVYPKWL